MVEEKESTTIADSLKNATAAEITRAAETPRT